MWQDPNSAVIRACHLCPIGSAVPSTRNASFDHCIAASLTPIVRCLLNFQLWQSRYRLEGSLATGLSEGWLQRRISNASLLVESESSEGITIFPLVKFVLHLTV